MKLIYSLVLLSTLIISTLCRKQGTAADDLVENMPLFGEHSYDIYAGYLDVTDNGSRQLFYTLMESQSNPKTDPLVIWLNGGPGCSSLLGMIQENGPFLFQGINTFLTDMQETSWNNNANVLYIEGPLGVGYSINDDFPGSYTYSDENTGKDFLSGFLSFREKFQGTLNFENPLWLSGESYAGMYVPFFAKNILNYNNEPSTTDKINLKGFLVGNNVQINDDTLFDNTMVGQYVENYFVNNEIKDQFYNCILRDDQADCKSFNQVYKNVSNNTDAYQIYNYTYSYGPWETQKSMLLDHVAGKGRFMSEAKDFILGRKGGQPNEQGQDPDSVLSAYFNLEEVRKALHVTTSNRWYMCSGTVGMSYHDAPNSNQFYPEFVQAGLDILIFSGNTDAVVPWQYTYICINELMTNPDYKIELKEQGAWRQWKKLPNKQVGGMVQYYDTGYGGQFVYAMVRGAGHEVPEYQPVSAYHMFNNFINGQPI